MTAETHRTKDRKLPLLLMVMLLILSAALLTSCGHQHTYGKWVAEKEPNCTENGLNARVCECGEKETEVISAKGHTDGEWVIDTDATCTESGSKHLTCAVCSATFQNETIPAIGHTDGEWVIDTNATCTESGSKHLTCAVCSATFQNETIPATDHKDGEWVIDTNATCTESGSKHLTCAVCSATFQNETIPATGHTDGEWVTDKNATCTDKGSKRLICATCNATLKTEQIEATGHKGGEWITDKNATCTKAGSKHQVCSSCSATIKTETIAATGNHEYSPMVTSEASCVSTGVKTFTCSGCGDSYTEAIECKIYTATEIYENHLNSVGEITAYDKLGNAFSLGTGFVYSTDGKIITNYHVIENAYFAEILFGGVKYPVQYILAYDKNIDIAVLKISANNLTPVKLCERNHKVGEIVYTLGSSKGLTATFSDGIITYSNRVIDGVSYTQHDAPISSGNSGGPLINKYGEIIGINTMTVRESQNLNFAINVSELNNLNYGSPLTMAEYYQKECDVYTNLKNYIFENGSYSSSDDCYTVICDVSYSADYSDKYTRMAYYYVSEDVITLDMLINDGEYWVYFEIEDSLDGSYFWEYFDDYDYKMSGTLYATTYDDETLLGYNYSNTSNSSTRDSIRSLASIMVSYICSNIDSDFSAIGVTAESLQFYCY